MKNFLLVFTVIISLYSMFRLNAVERDIRKMANYSWNCDVDSYLNRGMIIRINDDVGTYDGIADPELAGHPLR